MNSNIEVQGHRGCRGLLPENTLPAFKRALELGVTTLEMDLVVSMDKQVVVSHEPFFSHEISTDPNGNSISEEDEKLHNLFRMTYNEIREYDVGLRPHPRFPKQEKLAVFKPMFSEVVQEIELMVAKKNLKLPQYNAEIKRKSQWDSIFHPGPKEFAQIVIATVQQTGIKERITIQSFDMESLQLVRELDPDIRLVLLIENDQDHVVNLEKLGFVPEVYSPEFNLVTTELVEYCKSQKLRLIPWTVNSEENMKKMIDLGVDGIITDYPDVLISLLNELKITVQ